MRPIVLYYLTVVIFFIVCGNKNATAQSDDYEIDGYSATLYTDIDGLPQNSVKSIAKGRNGQIWFITEAGLVNYDGNRFITFNKLSNGSDRFRNFGIYFNRIYAASVQSELFDITGETPEKKGNIQWVFDYLSQFTSPDSITPKSTFMYSPFGLIESWGLGFTRIVADGKAVYIFHKSRIYCINERQQMAWEYEIPSGTIQIAIYNNTIIIILEDWKEIFLVDAYSKKVRLISVPNDYRTMLWNKTEKQLFIITKSNEVLLADHQFKLQKLLTLPRDFTLNCALYDRDKQTVFLGSGKSGLLVCKPKQFRSYSNLQLNESVFYSIAPYSDTSVITPYGYVVGKNGNFAFYPKHPGFSTSAISSYKKEKYITMSWNHKLISYGNTSGIHELIEKIDEPKSFYVEEDSIWMGTAILGFQKIYDGKITKTPIKSTVKDIFPLNENYFLLATGEGIILFEKATHNNWKLPLTENIAVREFERSSSGRLYATTETDGILLIDYSGIKKLPLDKNEYLKYCHTINEDSQNRFWITCNKGLFCIPENDLLHQPPNRNGHIFYYYFGKENGFKTNEFNGGVQSSSAKLGSGEFVLSSLDGLVWFNPDSTHIHFPSNKLKLTYTVLDDTLQLQAKDTVEITSDFRRMEIFLSCPFYGDKKNIQLEYNINDDDENQWIEIDIRSSLVFTYLKPGYTHIKFRVRKGFGENAFTYLDVVYYRTPKIWERTFFYPCIILLVTILAFILYKIRTKSLEKRNENLQKAVEEGKQTIVKSYNLLEQTTDQLKSKTRFQNWLITSLVHDLRGPLRFITQYGHYHQDKKLLDEEGMDFFKSVLDTNKNMYTYSEQLLQMLKLQQSEELLPEELDMEKNIGQRIASFAKELEWKKIDVRINIGENKYILINAAAISIIIQNLLDNAIKLQVGGALTINFTHADNKAYLELCDEGPGMAPALLHHLNKKNIHETDEYPEEGGLGMWLVLSMVKKTGGEITFENTHVGLRVKINWPQ